MPEAAASQCIQVTVLYSPGPRITHEWPLALPRGATVQQALEASGLPSECPDVDLNSVTVGVWGSKASLGQALRDLDRVEVYRDLKVDPKVARRERFKKQGARSAGLFAQRRKGAKPGY